MRIRSFLRSHPLRSLGALAIVLPLGLDPASQDLAGGSLAIPEDLLADVRAVAAVGAVLHSGPEPTACASVVVRQSERAPRLVHVEWRSLDRDPVSGEIALRRDADSDLEARGAGLELWEGCAPISRPLREARLFLTLEQKAADHRSASHRVASVEMRPGNWTWRPLRDLPEIPSADGATTRDGTETYRADRGSGDRPEGRGATSRSRGR
jgi:hypothetical protein